MTSNTTIETTQTTSQRNETPAVQAERALCISVRQTFRDSDSLRPSRTEATHELAIPMPERGQEIRFAWQERETNKDEFCATASAAEDFLWSVGLRLPGRKLATKLLSEVKTLTSRIAGIEANATDNITRARHERDQQSEAARGWQQYAEALEARIERGGGRLSKQLRELRPVTKAS